MLVVSLHTFTLMVTIQNAQCTMRLLYSLKFSFTRTILWSKVFFVSCNFKAPLEIFAQKYVWQNQQLNFHHILSWPGVFNCPNLYGIMWKCPLLHIIACFMWSPVMWSLNEDHIAGTTFLHKIVPNVKLQKSIKSTLNV